MQIQIVFIAFFGAMLSPVSQIQSFRCLPINREFHRKVLAGELGAVNLCTKERSTNYINNCRKLHFKLWVLWGCTLAVRNKAGWQVLQGYSQPRRLLNMRREIEIPAGS